MNITRKLRTFFFILRSRPAYAWELLQIRTERKVGIPLYFLSLRRLSTRVFELLNTSKVPPTLQAYGNYYLDPTRLSAHPVVFSLGVGQDIAFDQAMLQRHEPELFLFDPTPNSKRYIEQLNLPPNVRFTPTAVADYDGTVDVFIDTLETDFARAASVSIFNRGFQNEGVSVECKRVKTLMRERGIEHLDVLKMDIEGAAIQVLRDVLKEGILPTQIPCEFERPRKLTEVYKFLNDMAGLFAQLKGLGYEIYRTREVDKGCQIEIVAVRQGDRAQPARPS
jgi:FkbM family methyltransferase